MTRQLKTFAVVLFSSMIFLDFLMAQEPYTLSPTIGGNTYITNGAGSGYSPSFTASSRLKLSLSPGATFCGTKGAEVKYAGGTLTMVNGNNYVYLDPTASCAPTSSTNPSTFGQVPIAIVTASRGQITGMRTPGTTKQDSAITNIGTGPGVVIDVPGMGSGLVTSQPNNAAILDFRQTQDALTGSSGPGMVRTPVMHLTQRLGDLTTVPLTGTVTLSPSSTTVTGTGSHFLSEINPANSFGVSIKASADASTCWTEVRSVADDTHATLVTGGYLGGGCHGVSGGAAQTFYTQEGLEITNTATAGTPNTPAAGESLGLIVVSNRTDGKRPLFGGNINFAYHNVSTSNSPTDSLTEAGLEIDNTNLSPNDVIFPWAPLSSSLHILCANGKKCGTGISIFGAPAVFGAGIWLNNSWDTTGTGAGVRLDGNQKFIKIVPLSYGATDTNPAVYGEIAEPDNSFIWQILGNGQARFGQQVGQNNLQVVGGFGNRSTGSGTASIGFDTTTISETSAYKGGIGLQRRAGNGVGTLCLYNRITADSGVNFGSEDTTFCSTVVGALNLNAQGTNQNITLTPSGTGNVVVTTNIQSEGYSLTTPGTIVNAGTCASGGTITIAGLTTSSVVIWSTAAALPATWQTGIHVLTDVSTSGTAKVWLCNGTAGNITPAALLLNIRPIL